MPLQLRPLLATDESGVFTVEYSIVTYYTGLEEVCCLRPGLAVVAAVWRMVVRR